MAQAFNWAHWSNELGPLGPLVQWILLWWPNVLDGGCTIQPTILHSWATAACGQRSPSTGKSGQEVGDGHEIKKEGRMGRNQGGERGVEGRMGTTVVGGSSSANIFSSFLASIHLPAATQSWVSNVPDRKPSRPIMEAKTCPKYKGKNVSLPLGGLWDPKLPMGYNVHPIGMAASKVWGEMEDLRWTWEGVVLNTDTTASLMATVAAVITIAVFWWVRLTALPQNYLVKWHRHKENHVHQIKQLLNTCPLCACSLCLGSLLQKT